MSETNGKISKAGAAVVMGIVATVGGGMFAGFLEVASILETNQTETHALIREIEESHKEAVLGVQMACNDEWRAQFRACFDKLTGGECNPGEDQ